MNIFCLVNAFLVDEGLDTESHSVAYPGGGVLRGLSTPLFQGIIFKINNLVDTRNIYLTKHQSNSVNKH